MALNRKLPRGYIVAVFFLMAFILTSLHVNLSVQRQSIELHNKVNDNKSDSVPKYAYNTTNTPLKTAQLSPANSVLLFTYMRGGSSLLGELFNKNTHATYWFEPVDALYSSMYGTQFGWHPIDINYYNNGTPRSVSPLEQELLMKGLINLFACRLSQVPTEVFTSHLFTHTVQTRFRPFVKCIRSKESLQKRRMSPDRTMRHCKNYLTPTCRRVFEAKTNGSLEMCKRNINIGSFGNSSSAGEKAFSRHRVCVNTWTALSATCMLKLLNACDQTAITAVKTIRLRAAFIIKLLRNIGGLKVIHLVRDPRGILSSRKSIPLLSFVPHNLEPTQPLKAEARLLCESMLNDLSELAAFSSNDSGRVVRVRYEDIVAEPVKVATQIYDFLGHSLPQEAMSWFEESVHARRDTGSFGTSRRNGKKHINEWQSTLSKDELQAINSYCSDVINELEYDL